MTLPAHDRLTIITGADSRMGKATAELLASEEFDVGITFHPDEAGADDTPRPCNSAPDASPAPSPRDHCADEFGAHRRSTRS